MEKRSVTLEARPGETIQGFSWRMIAEVEQGANVTATFEGVPLQACDEDSAFHIMHQFGRKQRGLH